MVHNVLNLPRFNYSSQHHTSHTGIIGLCLTSSKRSTLPPPHSWLKAVEIVFKHGDASLKQKTLVYFLKILPSQIPDQVSEMGVHVTLTFKGNWQIVVRTKNLFLCGVVLCPVIFTITFGKTPISVTFNATEHNNTHERMFMSQTLLYSCNKCLTYTISMWLLHRLSFTSIVWVFQNNIRIIGVWSTNNSGIRRR